MTDTSLDFLTGDELASELRRRRAPSLFKTVPDPMVPTMVADGWVIEWKNRDTTRLRRPKPIDQALEDDVWALLARVGFTYMSAGRTFKIPVAKNSDVDAAKQIDVLAADDETVIVVECKSAQKVTPKSLGKDILEAQALRGPMAAAVRQHFGAKKKIGWLFVTRNIVWGKADMARADQAKIRVMTDNDLDYYLRLADIIGPAARHQLQAEVFGNQEVDGLARTVPAVRGRIGGRRFFQFTIQPDRLLKIAFVSHRAKLDKESIGTYQRMLKKNRLLGIRKYIDEGGVFPTNVVVNFRTKVRFDASADKSAGEVEFGTLYLPKTYKAAWIIDGQHRLYGYAGSKWASSNQLPVLAFEQLDPADEAKMFVDINSKQVKVPPNLLIQLASELYWGSPVASEALHALHSKVVAVLGTDVASPLRGRIVQEGQAQTSEKPLTTTALYEALKKTALIGGIRKGVLAPGPLYAEDDGTAVVRSVDILSRYLRVFSDGLPAHWALGNAEGGYLCTNNGITALLFVLSAVIDHLDKYADNKPWQGSPDVFSGWLEPYIDPIIAFFKGLDLAQIKDFRRQVGNLGQRTAAFAMMHEIAKVKPGFNPDGLEDYVKSLDRSGTMQARQLMPELQLKIQGATLRLLRSTYGHDEDGWWRKGVPIKVRTEVAARREANERGGQIEQFFELLDYKAIAYAQQNWEAFKPFFAMGPKQGKDPSLSWFDRLSELRNRISHPERGAVSDEEIQFLERLIAHFDDVEPNLP